MPTRTIPEPTPLTKPFFDACAAGTLQIQRCADCDTWVFYPRNLCPACFGMNLEWQPVSGRGTVYSFILCHVPGPGFSKDECPYVSAIVELEEGVRLHTNLVGVDPTPDAVRIGLPVQVEFERLRDDVAIPLFRPVDVA